MVNTNKMKLEFFSKSVNEGFARGPVAAFVAQLDPTLEELADIKTAVSEAVTNAVVHGYGHPNGMITIECTVETTPESQTVTLPFMMTGAALKILPWPHSRYTPNRTMRNAPAWALQ